MARDAEVTALGAIEDANQRWPFISEQLHHEVAAAAEERTCAPVLALRADFNAQLAVTRSVTVFARACPASGPDVDGLPGADFIRALYQVVQSQPGLDQDLVELTGRCEGWLGEIRRWTPDRPGSSPARPTSPSHGRVLAAADDWWGFGADRLHDQTFQSLTAQGHHVTETVTTTAEGQVIQSAHVVFEPAQQTHAHSPAARRPLARLRALLGHRDGC